jgi:hypothetical protein
MGHLQTLLREMQETLTLTQATCSDPRLDRHKKPKTVAHFKKSATSLTTKITALEQKAQSCVPAAKARLGQLTGVQPQGVQSEMETGEEEVQAESLVAQFQSRLDLVYNSWFGQGGYGDDGTGSTQAESWYEAIIALAEEWGDPSLSEESSPKAKKAKAGDSADAL